MESLGCQDTSDHDTGLDLVQVSTEKIVRVGQKSTILQHLEKGTEPTGALNSVLVFVHQEKFLELIVLMV